VDEFCSSRRRQGFEALAECLLYLVEGHGRKVVRPGDPGISITRTRQSAENPRDAANEREMA
jgi:hypothetical protein